MVARLNKICFFTVFLEILLFPDPTLSIRSDKVFTFKLPIPVTYKPETQELILAKGHTTQPTHAGKDGIIIISDFTQSKVSTSNGEIGEELDGYESIRIRDDLPPLLFLISGIMTFTNCALASFFIPLNFGILRSFITISLDKQPLFLLFAAINLICMLDLVVALVEGILIWSALSREGCTALGATQVTIYFILSSLLTVICLFRITAVLRPRKYKKIAKRNCVLKILTGIVTGSILLTFLLITTRAIRFKYLGPPLSTGCSFFVVQEIFHLLIALLISITLVVNLALACTYCVLYRYFKRPISRTREVRTMRQGALYVTSLATFSHFICNLPAVLVSVCMCVQPGLVLGLRPPYRLILDFVLVLLPHLYSSALPLCLVTGNTLDRVKKAASVTNQSVRRVNDITRGPETRNTSRRRREFCEINRYL